MIADHPMGSDWVASDTAGIGWTYANGVLAAPAAATPSRKDVILLRLAAIDRDTSKPRTLREMQLNKASTKTWLETLDNEAVALRTELAGL